MIKLELFHDTVAHLKSLTVGFEVLGGVTPEQTRTLVDSMNEKIDGVIVTPSEKRTRVLAVSMKWRKIACGQNTQFAPEKHRRDYEKTMESSSRRNLSDPAILFDLDGTLVDTVYQHVTAWSAALRSEGIILPNWKIHRRIGMSGKSLVRQLLREMRTAPGRVNIGVLEKKHDAEFMRASRRVELLPGAGELLEYLTRRGIRWAIATTGNQKQTTRLLKNLSIPAGVPVVTGDDVAKAKPSPDVFVLAANRLGVPIGDCIVTGDSVWDILAAGRKSALGVGILSGGYSQEELEGAGAFRVYADPADLLLHIEDLGISGE